MLVSLYLQSGISALTWGAAGYSLLLTETASSGQLLELSLAHALSRAHRVMQRPPGGHLVAGQPIKQEVHALQVGTVLLYGWCDTLPTPLGMPDCIFGTSDVNGSAACYLTA